MPRKRLLWQLFAALCVPVFGALVVGGWLTSVEMARLSDEMAFRRLEEVAGGIAAAAGSSPDVDAAIDRARAAAPTLEIDVTPPDDDASPGREPPGRSRLYDAATRRRRRFVVRTVGDGPAAGTRIRVGADADADDRSLLRGQRSLLTWQLSWAALAAALGLFAARRMARPVEEMSQAATRLAGGAETAALPGAETRELADLAAAIGVLHHGPVSAPSGGGHYIAVCGFTADSWIVNDPYGELDLVNGGWANQAPTAGKGQCYSFRNLNPRWLPEGAASGWGWVFS